MMSSSHSSSQVSAIACRDDAGGHSVGTTQRMRGRDAVGSGIGVKLTAVADASGESNQLHYSTKNVRADLQTSHPRAESTSQSL